MQNINIPGDIILAFKKLIYGTATLQDDAGDFNRIPLVETKQIQAVDINKSGEQR